ncbi:Predicted metal-dependent hydrolase, TIM-barrel fold [Rhizobiales bacterium GAS188]|nr:Predicted metal-dependent hydrolase, TIM-barrel fold [Rhizobiales bacterium GAS188]
MDFGIVDAHAHIFPPLAGACGFADAATHLLHQQRAMHVHGNQPYRRASDHALVSERPLWNADDPSPAGRSLDVAFRAGECGRFEWRAEGEAQYVQFLPPYMTDLSMPAQVLIRQMDYVGVETCVLQNDHIYGNLAEDFAGAARDHPGRLIGLAQVEEAFAYRDEEIARLSDEVERLGMAGLYFTTTGLFRDGYRHAPSDRVYDPLWREVTRLRLPVFWVHSAKSPLGTYEDEMRHLARIVERHPQIRHVLVHGVPTALYADEQDRLQLPPILRHLLSQAPVSAEILYPIAWGGRMEYPYARALTHIRALIDAFGPERFLWGSDMPNVERYCTYRQSLSYLWNEDGFLNDQDRRRIFRDNALVLFSRSSLLPPEEAGEGART